MTHPKTWSQHASGDNQIGQNEAGHPEGQEHRLARIFLLSAHYFPVGPCLRGRLTRMQCGVYYLLRVPQLWRYFPNLPHLVLGD